MLFLCIPIAKAQDDKSEVQLNQSLEVMSQSIVFPAVSFSYPLGQQFLTSAKYAVSEVVDNRAKTSYSLDIKYIYNRKKKLLRKKYLNHNSGNFVKTEFIYVPFEEKTFYSVMWGQRHNLSRSMSFEYSLGLEYKNNTYNNNGFLFSTQYSRGKIDVRIIYSLPCF